MPHFSRLTDIITCSLSEILNSAANPQQTLHEIIEEMREGLTACRRNVTTSTRNVDRLTKEIADYESQVTEWKEAAKAALGDGDEDAARESLRRKVEVEDLIAGLRPELEAANSASQNMLRIQKALEARFSEALRKLEDITGSSAAFSGTAVSAAENFAVPKSRASDVEAELEALRKELGN
ncbi:MAG: PspA/IM30 family protein [Planctomycetaceae bacterium]